MTTAPLTFSCRTTGVRALDRLLGGGWVAPSLVLLRGFSGVGKSRLLARLGMLEVDSDAWPSRVQRSTQVCPELAVVRSQAEAGQLPVVVTTGYLFDRLRLDFDADVVLTLSYNARRNRLELRCDDKNRFGKTERDLFVAFDPNHREFKLIRTKPRTEESHQRRAAARRDCKRLGGLLLDVIYNRETDEGCSLADVESAKRLYVEARSNLLAGH